ncbi:hypothetical protein B0H14DRAFT_3437318 [Mycena olivaceomarginata]|nr:hypothetical protein B0H14DRAFT_3437318 [Mycena olivaceomarginata]
MSEVQNEQLKRVNERKYLVRARNKIDAFQALIDLISTKDVPTSFYCEKGGLGLDTDLAILIYELGGGAALHALNKAPISSKPMLCRRPSVALGATSRGIKVRDPEIGQLLVFPALRNTTKTILSNF